MTAMHIAERLGGAGVLRREVRSDLDLVELVHDGIPRPALEHALQAGDLDPHEARVLVGSAQTLPRERRTPGKLSISASDRLVRALRVIVRAEEALGDRDRARRWLRAPNRSLASRRPLDLLQSDVGTHLVERVLGQIEHTLHS